jgi:hypothetical protein
MHQKIKREEKEKLNYVEVFLHGTRDEGTEDLHWKKRVKNSLS